MEAAMALAELHQKRGQQAQALAVSCAPVCVCLVDVADCRFDAVNRVKPAHRQTNTGESFIAASMPAGCEEPGQARRAQLGAYLPQIAAAAGNEGPGECRLPAAKLPSGVLLPLEPAMQTCEGWRLWQEGYLDVMMPILELTIKQASGKKQRRADPANKAWRRKEIIARNKRQAKGGIFKVRLLACSSLASAIIRPARSLACQHFCRLRDGSF